MKVLGVTPYPVLPPTHGWRVRSLGLARGLAAAGAGVDMLAPWAPGMPWRPTEIEGVRVHPHRWVANLIPALVPERLVPPLVGLSLQPLSGAPRRRLDAYRGHDVVVWDGPASAEWMGRAPRGPLQVYSAHNVESDFLCSQPGPVGRSSRARERLRRLEETALGRCDLVVTCTQNDADRLRGLYGSPRRTLVIPQGHDVVLSDLDREALRPPARRALGLRDDEVALLFVGGPAEHNREALRFLERDVLPALSPRYRLLTAGGCARGRGPRASMHLGFVRDLRPLFAAADIAVNPAKSGGGQNVKLTEYLAAGLPVVSTEFGMRGAEHLAAAVRVAPRARFGAAVKAQAGEARAHRGPVDLERLTWPALGRRLHDALAELLSNASPDRA